LLTSQLIAQREFFERHLAEEQVAALQGADARVRAAESAAQQAQLIADERQTRLAELAGKLATAVRETQRQRARADAAEEQLMRSSRDEGFLRDLNAAMAEDQGREWAERLRTARADADARADRAERVVEALRVRVAELEEEIRDLMTHLDTAATVRKANPERRKELEDAVLVPAAGAEAAAAGGGAAPRGRRGRRKK
jgi:BRCA1-associated protein